MRKIGTVSISATSTSANLTEFNFGSLPQGINGKILRLWASVPAVSAATCCATVVHEDVNNNIMYRPDTAKDASTWAENTSGYVNASEQPIVEGDHFHLVWSARPSGGTATPGENVVTELKLLIEEG